MRAAPPDLDAFLDSLRVAGLPIGARERLRLQQVFELAPRFDPDQEPGEQLHRLLASALVHDPDEGRLFDRIYGLWSGRWEEWLNRGAPSSTPLSPEGLLGPPLERTGRTPKKAGRARWKRWFRLRPKHRWRLVALVLNAVVVLAWIHWPDLTRRGVPVVEHQVPDPRKDPPPPPVPPPTTEGNFAKPIQTVYRPHFEMIDELEGFGVDAWRLATSGSLLLVALGLGLVASRKARPIEARPSPTEKGPRRLPLLPLPKTGPELLDEEAIRTLVWGVERHVTEDLSREIDAPATAHASAQEAGMPELRFVPEERLREVWLWLDATAPEDTLIEPWAAEIAEQLRRAGLPVRIGWFDGIPDELAWDESHQRFDPQTAEAHRQTALVALLSDGEVLQAHLQDQRRASTLAALRALGGWPRLALVDCSSDGDLATRLPEVPLPVITPAGLPAFFGLGSQVQPPVSEVDPGTLRAWRAALTLGHRPTDRATALALARRLDLDLPPWAVRQLADRDPAEADDPGLVRWLARDGQEPQTGIRRGSLLDGALAFWQRRFESEVESRSEREALDGWRDSRAERHLELELALVELWRHPVAASQRLASLRGGEFDDLLRDRLEELAPRECAGDSLVPLPWRLADLDDVSAQRLASLGLGGVTEGTLRRPGRWVLGLSMLVLASLVPGIRAFTLTPVDRAPRVVEVDAVEGSRVVTERVDDGTWRVTAISPDGEVETRPEAGGQELRVQWSEVVTERQVPRMVEIGGIEFVGLRGGSARMGSEPGEPEAYSNEHPRHDVAVGDFWITQTELTNAQYRVRTPDHPVSDHEPVTEVTWFEARAYCQSLGDGEGEQGWIYDLPSEAEWEYAARAGTTTHWSFGSDEKLLEHYAWYGGNARKPQPVQAKAPNPWGLYDMHGNVWEWVLDCYGDYPEGPLDRDPALVEGSCHQDDTRSVTRVLRGGSFRSGPGSLRSAYRVGGGPEVSGRYFGFRCVRRPAPQLDPSSS